MRRGGWERIPIRTEEAGFVEAVAPVLVSASRRTDIPAFHADWFLRRLRAGYVRWENPFSGRPQYVAFDRTRAIVFWTKDPRPLLPHLDELDRHGIGYYFQFTLNDYQAEGLEPAVPPLPARLEAFRTLSERLGRARVVWRFDPLLLADGLPAEELAARVIRVGERLHPFTERLVIAFADIRRYAKVQSRLRRFGRGCRELAVDEMREVAARLAGAARGWGISIATCAEAIDLADLGIGRSRCIDDALLERLFPQDAKLLAFLGPAESRSRLKDPGQRPECGCIRSKDIGRYDTCPHACRYCYANPSEPPAAARLPRHP